MRRSRCRCRLCWRVPARAAEQIVAGQPRLRVLHQVFISLRLSRLARPPELNHSASDHHVNWGILYETHFRYCVFGYCFCLCIRSDKGQEGQSKDRNNKGGDKHEGTCKGHIRVESLGRETLQRDERYAEAYPRWRD